MYSIIIKSASISALQAYIDASAKGNPSNFFCKMILSFIILEINRKFEGLLSAPLWVLFLFPERIPMQNQKSSHLSYEERVLIEDKLNAGMTVSQIARCLSRPSSTISREIKKHRQASERFSKKHCAKYITCTHRHLCSNVCKRKCRDCSRCYNFCSDYEKFECPTKSHSPYVCNACIKKKACRQNPYIYKAAHANRQYHTTLRDARIGFCVTQSQLEIINNVLKNEIPKKKSLYSIVQNYDLEVSERTLRRMVNSGITDIRNIDMLRTVKFRKASEYDYRKDRVILRESKSGHTYADYLKYISEHEDTAVVEMDTVVSKRGTPASLLTLMFTQDKMQIAFFMPKHDFANVLSIFNQLEMQVGTEIFKEMFPVILTDNGTEFSNRELLERSIYGGKRTIIFYCDSYSSSQKPHCENNHTFIRRVIPKGTDFSSYTQEQITLMMNHINSYPRQILHGSCPYDLAFNYMDVRFIEALGLEKIQNFSEINLSPSLLK